jgi:hypothetical protein
MNFCKVVTLIFLLFIKIGVESFHIPQTLSSRKHRLYHRYYRHLDASFIQIHSKNHKNQLSRSSTLLFGSNHVFGPLGKETMLSNPTQLTQTILVLSSLVLLAGYHLVLILQERSSATGSKTWRQYQADTREDWSRYVRRTEGWLYAVQTLRNAITAQTFLATTVLSLLTLITGRMWEILRPLYSSISIKTAEIIWERRLLTIQLMSIAITMLLSAYNFLQGVRLMTHAGFMFPVTSSSTKVDKIMRRSQTCQWMGLRWMYLSLGPISWTMGGSRAFFGVSLILVHFFRCIDRRPQGMGYEEFQGEGI